MKLPVNAMANTKCQNPNCFMSADRTKSYLMNGFCIILYKKYLKIVLLTAKELNLSKNHLHYLHHRLQYKICRYKLKI
jgi:hypothetical protein